MPSLTDILKNVNDLVNDFDVVKPKKKYSEPKIYTVSADLQSVPSVSKQLLAAV